MAGEWVKMRAALFKNPKVLSIAKVVRKEPALARMLNGADNAVTNRVTLDVTVASLLRVWSSASEFVKNGETLRGVTLEDLDVIAEVAGFGQAMAAIGWAEYDPAAGAVILPNFDEYNVSAEDRAKTPAQRSADYRARKRARERHENRDDLRDDLRDEKRDASRQKRREEKRLTATPQPPASGGRDGQGVSGSATKPEHPPPPKPRKTSKLVDPDGVVVPEPLKSHEASIRRWLIYKREKGQGYKPTGISALWRMLEKIKRAGGDVDGAIDFSMAQNWQGVFPPRGGTPTGKYGPAPRISEEFRQGHHAMENLD